jgi:hypothetical protein
VNIIKTLDKQELQAIVVLKRTPDFKTFLDILNKSVNVLFISNASQKDEIVARWNQGRTQEILDILNKIKNADEDLRNYKESEARRHIE